MPDVCLKTLGYRLSDFRLLKRLSEAVIVVSVAALAQVQLVSRDRCSSAGFAGDLRGALGGSVVRNSPTSAGLPSSILDRPSSFRATRMV